LDVITRVYMTHYRYPEDYRVELTAVSDYCREHDIDLNFILFPNHRDLQDKIRDYDLVESAERMRADLGELGRVYDFAFANPLTENRNNYKDPYHFNDAVMAEIVENVWSAPGDIVKVGGRPTVSGT
jgi:hypothetical protein